MNELLRLSLLGPPQIRVGERPLNGFSTHKAQALFFYLAVTGHAVTGAAQSTPHSRDALAKLLWGEMTDAKAKQNLRNVLSELSRLVGSHVKIERQAVAFDPAHPYWLDAEVFLRALTPNPSFVDLATRQAALDLYRDEFLSGFYVHNAPAFEDWVLEQRQRFHILAVKALFALVNDYIERADFRAALPNNRRLLSLEPWSEPAHRQQMLILARMGERSAALAQFKACQDILAAEFGVEPLAETTALYERIRAGEIDEVRETRHESSLTPPSLALAGSALPNFVNEGHGLQPVNRSAAPFQVPSPVTALLGREEDIERALRLFQRPNMRLMSVVGPPGVGKTRFSIELAHLLRKQFDDGEFFITLAPISRAEDMSQAICDVILPAYSAGQNNDSDALTNLKRVIVNKHVLLILDNFEHLLSDASAQIVNELLTTTPNLMIIITSREAIDLYGQYRLPLEPFNVPTVTEITEWAQPSDSVELHSYSAIALFEERAQATLPNFELTEANAQKVVQLCAMLDGLPLAIEIAASNLNRFTVSGLLRQLKAHPWDLHSNQRGVAQRHQSLHHLISHSYSLLRPDEQQVFCALSVFADSTNELGVAMVMGLPQSKANELLDHLRGLAAKSLIIHEIVEDTARFSMLQTLREYGLDILKSHEQEFEHRQRHAQYFLAFAEHANSQMRGEGYLYWMNQLELNHNNCRAALLWCQQYDTELGLELATAWADFWFQQGHASEGYEWLSGLLGLTQGKDVIVDLANHPLTTLIQCRAMCAFTKFTMTAGSMPVLDVIALLESQCLPLFRQHNDLYGEAIVKINMGDAHYCVNENSRGLAELTDGLTLLRNMGCDKDIVIALNFLVLCLLPVDVPAAVTSAEEALDRSQKVGNPSLIAKSTLSLSVARRWAQDYEGAVLAGQEAVARYRHIQDKLGLQDALIRLSQALTLFKRYDDSRAMLQEYFEMGQQLGMDHVPQIVWRNLGHIAYLEGNLAEALKQLLMSAQSQVQGNAQRESGLCLMLVVPVVARLGHPQAAVRIAEATLALFASLDHAVSPHHRQLLNEGVALARQQLSETDFGVAQVEGRSMCLEKAIAETQGVAGLTEAQHAARIST